MERAGNQRGEQHSGGLLKAMLDAGRKVAQVELHRVRAEMRGEARDTLTGVVMLGGAGLLALGGMAALTLAVAKVLLEHPGRSALLGLGLVGGAAGLAVAGVRAVPKPLAGVREQVRRDAQKVAEELS